MCLVATTGHMAGDSAGRFAAQHGLPDQNPALAKEKLSIALAPLGREGIAPKDAVRRLQEIVSACDVCILKTAEGLSNGLRVRSDAWMR